MLQVLDTIAATRAAIGQCRSQGLIGFVQYATHLPEILVGAHMAGACAVWLATLATFFATQSRHPATTVPPASVAVASAASRT